MNSNKPSQKSFKRNAEISNVSIDLLERMLSKCNELDHSLDSLSKNDAPVKKKLGLARLSRSPDFISPVVLEDETPSLKKVKKKSVEASRPREVAENLGGPNTIFLTVKQTALRFPIFTEAAIRDLIFKAEGQANYPDPGKHPNGFLKVIFRVPGQRRVLICEPALIEWLRSGQKPSV